MNDLHSLPHTLAICNAAELVAFQAPHTSSYTKKKDSQDKKPGAKTGRRKKSTSLKTKHNPLPKIEATKDGPPSKEETGSVRNTKKSRSLPI
ncbi:hypothetical protein Tco_0312094 [Tanacetum coccineum]